MSQEFAIDYHNKFAIITLNFQNNKNALSEKLISKVNTALAKLAIDDNINSVILTGEDFFSAGADLKEFAKNNYPQVYQANIIKNNWEQIANFPKPIISAVCGFAIGGGLEIMMMTDITIAERDTKFAQPEVKLGLLPGAGGTQRITKTLGKFKAMNICLTGLNFDAEEAYNMGLLSYLVEKKQALNKAIEIANILAGFSLTALMKIKQAIIFANNSSLNQGLEFERNLFYSSFATIDAKNGIDAFLSKSKAKFNNS